MPTRAAKSAARPKAVKAKAPPTRKAKPKAPAVAPKEQKHALRTTLRHRRSVIPADLSNTTQWKVINHLRTLISDISPTAVALYSAMDGELNLHSLAEELWRDQQTVALPRVAQRGHPLVFNVWPPHGKLEPDAIGIPAANGPEIIPAVIIMPMLGYNRKGYRLGAGGGYYDITLAHLHQPTITVGVCHTELEIPHFPAEPHDVQLNYIVTGKEVIHCR
jgi:5-formyltetrahydrofolate cyclo-ligase